MLQHRISEHGKLSYSIKQLKEWKKKKEAKKKKKKKKKVIAISENENIPKIYVCEHSGCNKIFSRKSIFNKHLRVHIKSYQCSQCTQCFASSLDRRVHERIHSNQRSEVCPFCCKGFTDPAALRKHIKYIHCDGVTAKAFVCKHCQKQFSRKDSLQKHWQTHSKKEENRFKCDECNSTFSLKLNYLKHKRLFHQK